MAIGTQIGRHLGLLEVVVMGSSVRGRFAPTPSGYMHIGNALSAIWAWLQVRRLHREFILCIEDLDVDRFDPRYVDALMEDLKWLGVDWPEGPDVPGPYGPYRQQDDEGITFYPSGSGCFGVELTSVTHVEWLAASRTIRCLWNL